MFDTVFSSVLAGLLGTLCVLLMKYVLGSSRPHGGNRPVKIRPRISEIMAYPGLANYDLKTYQIAPSTGRMFQFFTWLLYTRLGRTVLLPLVKSNSSLDRLQNEYIPELPTFDTPHNPVVEDYSGENERIIQNYLLHPHGTWRGSRTEEVSPPLLQDVAQYGHNGQPRC